MNRTIRFRAYDNSWKKKVMIYFGIFDTDEGLYCKDGVTDIRKAEIMQFTGLKDKNGKKVFQGDILKVQSAKEDYGECSYGGFLKVVAETCGYRLEPFNPTLKEIEDKGEFWDSSSLWHITESKYIEVIGNIYENPNLLNQ